MIMHSDSQNETFSETKDFSEGHTTRLKTPERIGLGIIFAAPLEQFFVRLLQTKNSLTEDQRSEK